MFNLPIVVQSLYYLRMYVRTVCFIVYGNVFQGASKIIGVRTRGGGAEGPWFSPRFHKEGANGIWPPWMYRSVTPL